MNADFINAQQERGQDNQRADGDPGGGDRMVGNPAEQQADDGDVDFADHVDQRYRRGPAGALDLLVLVGREEGILGVGESVGQDEDREKDQDVGGDGQEQV